MKTLTSLEYSAAPQGNQSGGLITTAASVVTLDVTTLVGSWVTLQALTADVDIYFADQVATPTVAPVITATALGTATCGERLFAGVDKARVVPTSRSGKMWLVTQATAAGTLRVIPS